MLIVIEVLGVPKRATVAGRRGRPVTESLIYVQQFFPNKHEVMKSLVGEVYRD